MRRIQDEFKPILQVLVDIRCEKGVCTELYRLRKQLELSCDEFW